MTTIIVGVFFSFLYLIGLVFCTGHGGRLLSGYHYQPKTKRAMKYHRRIMLRVGLWFIFVAACVHGAIMFAVYNKMVWFGVFLAVSIITMILGVIYANASKKMAILFKLERDDYKEHDENDENEEMTNQ